MKTSGSKSQQGFTLIEVSLAIVIGVIVLAGAITMYNQTKVNAANSTANTKAVAMASLVEELMAAQGGAVPTTTSFGNAWSTRRDDAAVSPYGGATTGATQSMVLGWQTIATQPAATASDIGKSIYAPGTGTAINYFDNNAGTARIGLRNYFVGTVDSTGRPAFIYGGK